MNYHELSPSHILDAVHTYLYGKTALLPSLFNDLLEDCGIEGCGLQPQDLIDAFHDEESCKWRKVCTACTACLTLYAAKGCSNLEFVRSIGAIFILSNCVHRGFDDWERSFDFILKVLFDNRLKCDLPMRMAVLKYVLARQEGHRK